GRCSQRSKRQHWAHDRFQKFPTADLPPLVDDFCNKIGTSRTIWSLSADDRYWGLSRHSLDQADTAASDPMYGPAVRCKRHWLSWWRAALHQCIRPLIAAGCPWPSWISARVRSHYRTGLNGPFGSPVLACPGKTEPPSPPILSQTSASTPSGASMTTRLSR